MVGSLRGEISVQLGEGSGEQSHQVMQFPPIILWVLLRSLYSMWLHLRGLLRGRQSEGKVIRNRDLKVREAHREIAQCPWEVIWPS